MPRISRRISGLTRLAALTLLFAVPPATFARPATPHSPMDAVKLHQKLTARGIGKEIKVTELDDTIIKGTLLSIDADSFKIAPGGIAPPITILNTQVSNIGTTGMSNGTRLSVGIAVGLAVGVGIIVAVVELVAHK